ncbi:MAG: glycoside hydrolase family 3 C-terminal domain-containing protein [Anaerolineae bacterium]|nr:glycoside hydrolase family 3 C-terminal domain-containing protein [Anaerolineae bacterium]
MWALSCWQRRPHAEGVGDRADLRLSEADAGLIERVRGQSRKLVVILLSGRPLVITEHLAASDAFVAAWLPGTEGQGMADVLWRFPLRGQDAVLLAAATSKSPSISPTCQPPAALRRSSPLTTVWMPALAASHLAGVPDAH